MKKMSDSTNNITFMVLLCWEGLQGICSGLNITLLEEPDCHRAQTALRRGYTYVGVDKMWP